MGKPCFEIGLVGAGAISAGAYTGGVIDFMVQALDEWYKAANGPAHDVKLSVFSGASAGAITATLSTAFLASDQPPVTTEAEAAANAGKNKLFDAWVDRIDISWLLQDTDLGEGSKVVSLLDSSVLTKIADEGLNIQPRAVRRPYVADGFALMMTVTNLRGVPYRIDFESAQAGSYTMSMHADYVQFSFADQPAPASPDRYSMTWSELGRADHPVKARLKTTALASGAFPVGLAPRSLNHVFPGAPTPDPYSARVWPVPTPVSPSPHYVIHDKDIAADWGKLPAGYRYDYVCVDGGVMDNEPFELARRHLAGPNGSNSRDPEKADRAVLLIDPFPGDVMFKADEAPPADILGLIMKLFDALKNQARFKPDELVLAASPDTYSRFMIAPKRDDEKYPIACGGLGGFGGFLKRDFRQHDYFLGRRNAQKFFRDHFVMAESNPLFANWTDDLKKTHRVTDSATGKTYLPVIPLVGSAATVCFPPTWPTYTEADLAKLSGQIKTRIGKVIGRLVDQYFHTNNIVFRFIAGWVLKGKTTDITGWATTVVAKQLQEMKLMKAPAGGAAPPAGPEDAGD